MVCKSLKKHVVDEACLAEECRAGQQGGFAHRLDWADGVLRDEFDVVDLSAGVFDGLAEDGRQLGGGFLAVLPCRFGGEDAAGDGQGAFMFVFREILSPVLKSSVFPSYT